MSCRIMVDKDDGRAVFICSTSDVAFGPIMLSAAWAHAFAKWLGRNPREIAVNELCSKWGEFRDSHCECRCGEIVKGGAICDDCLELQREEQCENAQSST